MPLYEYLCPENGRTVEVRHRMSDEVRNWGELCECAGLEAADTRPESPVERLMSAPVPLTTRDSGPVGPASCGPGCACAAEG
jgi:hypothetical protein